MRPTAVAISTPPIHRIEQPALHIAEGTIADIIPSEATTSEKPNLHLADLTSEQPIVEVPAVDEATVSTFTANLLRELNADLGLLKGNYIDTYSLKLSDDRKTLTLRGRASTNHFKGQAMTHLYNRLTYGETRETFWDLSKYIRTLELNFSVGAYPSPVLTMNI